MNEPCEKMAAASDKRISVGGFCVWMVCIDEEVFIDVNFINEICKWFYLHEFGVEFTDFLS